MEKNGEGSPDGTVLVRNGRQIGNFNFEVKKKLTLLYLLKLIANEPAQKNKILVSDRIPQDVKDYLRKAKELDLIPDDNGNILFTEKFWDDEFVFGFKPYVDPILVYADLMNHPTPRNIEAAKLINENYINVNV